MPRRNCTRRRVLQGGAVGVAALLAGCTGGGDGDGGSAVTTPDVPTIQNEPDYGGWFDGVSNYRDTYDFTGRSEVSVAVGAPGNGGNYAFAPAAIAVSTGTRVVWEWTGKDGPHNVVANDGAFESDLKSGDDARFTHTFSSPAVHQYYCQPHMNFGMKGAVVVRE